MIHPLLLMSPGFVRFPMIGRCHRRRELTAHLRSGHVTRRPQGRPVASGRGQITDKVMISERPAEADDRAVPGHWEGDMLLGKLPTAILTLVERSSRFTQLVACPTVARPSPFASR